MNTEKSETPHEPPERNDLYNPLWIVVGGMVWLFGVLLAILAFGGGSS